MKNKVMLGAAALLALACSDSPTVEVPSTPPALLSVSPADGMTDVATDAAIEVRFDGPVAPNATMLVALQVGDCPGPVVSGMWSRSADGTLLSFTPMQPLQHGMRYTIHLGGGMTGANGAGVDIETHGPGLGGMWVTQSMVMGMNNMGMGMGMVSHMGPGWQHANGFYGLAFEFTTGAPAGD